MADAAIDLQASNIFGLGSEFNTQSSTTTVGTQNVATNDESGNVACQQNITEQTDYTQTATYCGSDFWPDLENFIAEFGNVTSSNILVTQMVINMTAGDYVSVELTGHNHETNPHIAGLDVGFCDATIFAPVLTAWDGFGVIDFGVTTGSDASPSSATLTLSMNHIDTNDEGGDHLVGKNITPRAELTMDFEGVPISNTSSAIEADLLIELPDAEYIVDSTDTNDSNSEFDTFSFAAHANTFIATVLP